MNAYIKAQLHTKKLKREGVGYLAFFLLVFYLVDALNMSYAQMATDYGVALVGVNLLLNAIMAGASSFLMMLSSIMVGIKGVDTKGSSMGFLSVIFALLTYGCTPCVIALLANFGIAFSVIVFPLAGLPYKFITLGLIAIGIAWSYYDINKGSCDIKFKKTEQN